MSKRDAARAAVAAERRRRRLAVLRAASQARGEVRQRIDSKRLRDAVEEVSGPHVEERPGVE